MLLPFLVRVQNALAKERQRCKARAKAKKSKANMTNGNGIVDDITVNNLILCAPKNNYFQVCIP